MNKFEIPEDCTYISAFLTFACPLNCRYCINGKANSRQLLSTDGWIEGLSRLIISRENKLPITLTGGEPTLHPGFLKIVKELQQKDYYIDILTNLEFDHEKFCKELDPKRFYRDVPYPAIRVSYHPTECPLLPLVTKVRYLQDKGFPVGLYMVNHPAYSEYKSYASCLCKEMGIDFRIKDYLGIHEIENNGKTIYKTYGHYNHIEYIRPIKKDVECYTSEILIGPAGNVYRCHSDLYANENHIGNILDKGWQAELKYRPCNTTRACNRCDLKSQKNNRFQVKQENSVVKIRGKNGQMES